MKKLLLIAALFASISATAATSVDTTQLTDSQKAALQKTVDEMKSPSNISAVAREETEKWANLGGNMGRAAVGAAKEIGVAANEFVATPLGKVTMGVVIYKVIGRDIMKVVAGSFVLIFMFSLAFWLFNKKHYYGTVEYATVKTFFGLRTKQVVTKGTVDAEWSAAYMAAACVTVLIGLAVGLGCIF